MRKQVDLHVRTFPMGTGAGGESATYLQVSDFLKSNYFSQGWEVMSTAVAQVSAGVIFMAVTLVKYEEVSEPVTGGPDGVEVKQRGPGRPRKVDEPASG